MTNVQIQFISDNAVATGQFAKEIGQKLRGGEIIELVSDLGGGKTTFVRGLSSGFGSDNRVTSPSFTLSNEYKSKGKTMYHFDFYRLTDPGIIANELQEVIEDVEAIVVIEWANIVESVLSAPHIVINILHTGEDSRTIELEYPEKYNYLFESKT